MNRQYYEGFEGHPEVIVSTAEGDGLVIWEGYFTSLLSGCVQQQVQEGGLLASHMRWDGFYEEDLWEIESLELAIAELKQFREELLPIDSAGMTEVIKNVRQDLILLLHDARRRGLSVYVSCD